MKRIEFSGDRANTNGIAINVGSSGYPGAVFHEMGHHIEFDDPGLKRAANDFLQSRSTGKPQKLSKLMNEPAYQDHEVAYPDHFISPYVGRAYESGSTEVISVGMEHFTSGAGMLELYKADKEHFNFTLGVIRA